jgi:hypothetical protein
MSAGVFENVKYELDATNGGYIMSGRVQPETLAATDGTNANAEPAGAINAPGSAKVSKGRREFGVGMRRVLLTLTGSAPAGYSGEDVVIPVLTPATFTAWVKDTEITYQGTTWEVKERYAESVK